MIKDLLIPRLALSYKLHCKACIVNYMSLQYPVRNVLCRSIGKKHDGTQPKRKFSTRKFKNRRRRSDPSRNREMTI